MSDYIPIITLDNGIRLIHKEVPSQISHFGVLVNVGTRDEDADCEGVAHFVEHTIFKGTQRRNAYQVTHRVECVGGDLNACTAKEDTYFHASFLSSDYERIVELLADILFHATFPEKEIEKEKDVVIEEINYYNDVPAELIFDEIEEIVFAQHPLGKSILGTKRSLKRLSRQKLLQFVQQHYTADKIVLSSVGNISTEKLVKMVRKYFSHTLPIASARPLQPQTAYEPRFVQKHKNTSQAHLMLANISYPLSDDRRLPMVMLTNLLGGPAMSSRLNNTIREKSGLAYAVEANYTPFSDSGLFTIYAGCESQMVEKCIDLINKELKKLAETKLGTMQLHYAKKQLLGQVAITNEAKLNEMISMGRSALCFDKVETIEASFQKIEALTAETLLRVANEMFQLDNFSTLLYKK